MGGKSGKIRQDTAMIWQQVATDGKVGGNSGKVTVSFGRVHVTAMLRTDLDEPGVFASVCVVQAPAAGARQEDRTKIPQNK